MLYYFGYYDRAITLYKTRAQALMPSLAGHLQIARVLYFYGLSILGRLTHDSQQNVRDAAMKDVEEVLQEVSKLIIYSKCSIDPS